jgi:DNA-binding transcriptional LysR family regulator
MELAPGVVAQQLAPLHVIAVVSPEYLQGRQPPQEPHELTNMDGVSMRSALTGRLRVWRMRNREGVEATLQHKARLMADEPEAICRAVLMGLGVVMISMTSV